MRHTLRLNTLKAILGESVLACVAATLCVLLRIPVSAMFIGWIAFFTRGITARDGLINLGCMLIGLAIGIASELLAPHLGALTITPVALLVTVVVLSLRGLPVFNNLLSLFLGVVSFFASHLATTLATFLELSLACALGVLAGLLASRVQRHWGQAKHPDMPMS
ncbi:MULTISPECIES: DUF1097 domain-containing protein [Pseudomonas]|uniref:DUF1097 domain-containing protein n=1 Tax=Pseudomonas rhizophila TaxID=2045200 RepID=UPI001C474BC1|nr:MULTISPECIES: DUF1097 domain-containing protein [Pseudomonas]